MVSGGQAIGMASVWRRSNEESFDSIAARNRNIAVDPGRWRPRTATGRIDKCNDLPEAYRRNVETDKVPCDRKAGQRPRLSDKVTFTLDGKNWALLAIGGRPEAK
jgi:hypothetical protein